MSNIPRTRVVPKSFRRRHKLHTVRGQIFGAPVIIKTLAGKPHNVFLAYAEITMEQLNSKYRWALQSWPNLSITRLELSFRLVQKLLCIEIPATKKQKNQNTMCHKNITPVCDWSALVQNGFGASVAKKLGIV